MRKPHFSSVAILFSLLFNHFPSRNYIRKSWRQILIGFASESDLIRVYEVDVRCGRIPKKVRTTYKIPTWFKIHSKTVACGVGQVDVHWRRPHFLNSIKNCQWSALCKHKENSSVVLLHIFQDYSNVESVPH